jgi:hypothetical protein
MAALNVRMAAVGLEWLCPFEPPAVWAAAYVL